MHFIAAITFLVLQPPIVVDLPCPGAIARTIATEVAPLLEAAAKKLAGVEQVATASTPGRCRLFIDLKADADRAKVRGQLAEQLKAVNWPALVKEHSFVLQPDVADETELLLLTSTGQHDALYLSALAEHLRGDLIRLPGVAEVTTTGGRGRIACHLELERLAAFSLSLREVADGLRTALAKRPSPEVASPLADLANLEDAVIATKAGQVVRLRDVARVELGRQGQAAAGVLTAGSPPTDSPTIVIWLRPRPGQADAVHQALKATLPDLKKKVPEGVALTARSMVAHLPVFRLRIPDAASEDRRVDQARQVAEVFATQPLSGGVLWINEQPEMLVVPWPVKEGTKLDHATARRGLAALPAVQARLVAGCPAHSRPGEGQHLRVQFFGPSSAELAPAVALVRNHLADLPQVVELVTSPDPPRPEISFVPHAAKAKAFGLSEEELQFYLQAVRGPLPVGSFATGNGQSIEVDLVLSGMNRPDDLARLHLPNKEGQRIPWPAVFETQYTTAEPLVYRVNGQECQVVSANLEGNTNPNAVATELEKLKSRLPAGVRLAVVQPK